MADKKTIYIHIGSGKTATTAIQKFLFQNKKILEKRGVCYPHQRGLIAHHRLGQSLTINKKNKAGYLEGLNLFHEEWKEMLPVVRTDQVLISSEYFFGAKSFQVEEIRKCLQGYNVKIVAYLRRQDDGLLSRYNQGVKGQNSKSHSIQEFLEKQQKRKLFNYDYILKQWSDVFGTENVLVRPYEKGQFYNESIFSDFLHYVFGLDLTPDYVIPEGRVNPRLHRVALEYKRMVNCLPISMEQKFSILPLLLKVSERLCAQGSDDYPLLAPEQRMNIIRKYSAGNAQVARDYLGRGDGQLFYHSLPDCTKPWYPYDELKPKDAQLINQFFAENCSKTYRIIKWGILEAGLHKDEDIQKAAALLAPGINIQELSGLKRLKLMMALKRIYDKMKKRFKLIAKIAAHKPRIKL